MKKDISNKGKSVRLTTQLGFLLSFIAIALMITSSVVMAQSQNDAGNTNRTSGTQTADADIETFNHAYLPYLVKIVDEDTVTTTATPYVEPEIILDITGITLRPEDEYTLVANNDDSSKNQLVGYELIIDRATPVKLALFGSVVTTWTQSSTVGGLLDEINIELSETVVVEPSRNTSITTGMEVSVVRVGTETVTVEEDVDFIREFTDDKSMEYGTEIIKSPGTKGQARVTYEITYHNNTEVRRKKIKSVTLLEPVTEYVTRGAKNAPSSNGPLSPAQIQFLGNCEAGMNPTRNSGNGYYGAFQFSAGTWNAMNTGYARADLAPLDVQIQAVQRLLSRSSIFGQFPGCANQMVTAGLLQR